MKNKVKYYFSIVFVTIYTMIVVEYFYYSSLVYQDRSLYKTKEKIVEKNNHGIFYYISIKEDLILKKIQIIIDVGGPISAIALIYAYRKRKIEQ